jgi:hypothetical protein
MISLVRDGGCCSGKALALAWGIWALAGAPGEIEAGGPGIAGNGCETGNCGGPGFSSGFQGFGLGFHPGYGYGRRGLGVGPDGGYPIYGGPGYSGFVPGLRRFARIQPFLYNGGPGYPCPGAPNFFAGVGPLAVDPPVAIFTTAPDGSPPPIGDFGAFTGAIPYSEETLAPFASAASAIGTTTGVTAPYSEAPPMNTPPHPATSPR